VTYPDDIDTQDLTLARRPGRDGEPPVKTLIELPTFAIVAPSNGLDAPERPSVCAALGWVRDDRELHPC
jgi:hypothetical protein